MSFKRVISYLKTVYDETRNKKILDLTEKFSQEEKVLLALKISNRRILEQVLRHSVNTQGLSSHERQLEESQIAAVLEYAMKEEIDFSEKLLSKYDTCNATSDDLSQEISTFLAQLEDHLNSDQGISDAIENRKTESTELSVDES